MCAHASVRVRVLSQALSWGKAGMRNRSACSVAALVERKGVGKGGVNHSADFGPGYGSMVSQINCIHWSGAVSCVLDVFLDLLPVF